MSSAPARASGTMSDEIARIEHECGITVPAIARRL